MTDAAIGYGLALEIALASAPSDFTHVRETFDATPPSVTVDNVDASHFQSPDQFREYISGMKDGGEASFELNYVPGSATDVFLISLGSEALVARLTFANGVQVIFDCIFQGYERAAPNDDKKTATLTLKVSRKPYQSAAAAPRNLVLPSIKGTAKVGQVLTVETGEWAGAQRFTYQWQGDTAGNGTFANIAGETKQAMVVPVSQQGDDVRCVVTAANASAFTTAANSPETAAVAAA